MYSLDKSIPKTTYFNLKTSRLENTADGEQKLVWAARSMAVTHLPISSNACCARLIWDLMDCSSAFALSASLFFEITDRARASHWRIMSSLSSINHVNPALKPFTEPVTLPRIFHLLQKSAGQLSKDRVAFSDNAYPLLRTCWYWRGVQRITSFIFEILTCARSLLRVNWDWRV